jgi:hypothetical protein
LVKIGPLHAGNIRGAANSAGVGGDIAENLRVSGVD